jgi:pimeloyl-ACP methyl ester carboxylesterase
MHAVGGPGGSGVQTILDSGERVQTIIDATREPNSYQRIESPADVYFDVIGFDPRGVNHSVPRLDCFPNAFNRLVWTLESDAEGYAASSSNALDLSWSRYSSRSKSCIEQINQQGNDSIAYYIGTRSVVEDMVAIVESHGEWREAEAAKLHNARKFILPRHEQQMQLAESHWQHGKEPILFWGTSYGTLLGATVAAIYPDRVQRMVLDSVLSPQFFYQMKLGDSLIHADTVFNQFARLCHKYGPDRCNFYRDTEKAITNDIDDLMSSLKSAPLAVPATSFRGPTSITWTDVNQLIGRSIYRPHSAFPMLATLLQNTFERNGSAFADYKASLRSVAVKDALDDMYTLSPQCKNQGPFSTACDRPNEHLEEILLAIQCGDGGMPSGMTKGQFRTYWESVRNASSAMGNMWAEYDMMCVGWTAKTKWKHDGKPEALLKYVSWS